MKTTTTVNAKSGRAGRVLVWGAALLAVPLIAFLAYVQPGGAGVLASVRTPDGAEYLVEQDYDSDGPYNVGFYMRPPDGKWGWCYIDHEASRWRDVKVSYDAAADKIVVTERGVRRASLDRATGSFWIDNGSFSRSAQAPQEERNPTFAGR
jgi:hypothetical protein